MEHIIKSQMMNHLEKNNILCDFQYGLRKRRSCETQLLITAEDLARAINKRTQVDLAILDFSNAFDKVPRQKLKVKLE